MLQILPSHPLVNMVLMTFCNNQLKIVNVKIDPSCLLNIPYMFFFVFSYFRAAIEEQLGKSLVKLAKTLLIREELE